ncbi:hypothetical protein GOODEAATRI_011550 [Goodea atripinnis]|uniref:Uncharacterized protein n=1 Tax=Goodea atripinnis TaxID=208336 RepID=A0ABV0NAT8_9TELE
MCRDQSGVVKFFGSFAFNRKRNVLELEIRQDYTSSGTQKYVVSYRLQLSRTVCSVEIPRYVTSDFLHGFTFADSPLLWIRIDPDMSILRKVEFEQADFMWQYQLRYERDVVAQEEAITALEKFPTPASRLALTDILEQEQSFFIYGFCGTHVFHKVKYFLISAFILSVSRFCPQLSAGSGTCLHFLFCCDTAGEAQWTAQQCSARSAERIVTQLTGLIITVQIANSMMSTWQGPPAMKSLFTRMFCCKSCPNIVRTNNFINFQSYFLQKVQTKPKHCSVHVQLSILPVH